jgi:hypothetical protein
MHTECSNVKSYLSDHLLLIREDSRLFSHEHAQEFHHQHECALAKYIAPAEHPVPEKQKKTLHEAFPSQKMRSKLNQSNEQTVRG